MAFEMQSKTPKVGDANSRNMHAIYKLFVMFYILLKSKHSVDLKYFLFHLNFRLTIKSTSALSFTLFFHIEN